MSLPATDAFTGISGDPLSANWTTVTGSFQQGGAGTARSSHGSAVSTVIWNADTFPADQYAQALPTATSSSIAGVIVRGSTGSGGSYYHLSVYGGGAGAYIGKVINGGTDTVVIDFGGAASSVDGDVFKLEVSSATLKAFKNGTQIGTDQSDGSISTGAAGMIGYLANGQLKLFEGGAVGGGGGGGATFWNRRRRGTGI